MKKWLLLLGLMSLACATGSTPVSGAAPDAALLEDQWSLHVVTTDADGSDRVTRIWIALLDGDPVLRTGESRWWKNLERDASIRIRLSGTDHAYRADFVSEPSEKVRIDEVFLEKYGRWERLMFSQERGETHENYARLR